MYSRNNPQDIYLPMQFYDMWYDDCVSCILAAACSMLRAEFLGRGGGAHFEDPNHSPFVIFVEAT